MKGADIIAKNQPTNDNEPETSDFVVTNIVPVLTESERIRVMKEVNDALFQVFKKYYE